MTALHFAVNSGYVEVAKYLLSKGANINAIECDNTPLIIAARTNRLEIVRMLIDSGAAVDGLGSNGSTPLHHAAEQGHIEIVKLLIERGANINLTGGGNMTALHFAVNSGRIEVARYLLSKGANINSIECGSTPLHLAVKKGYSELVHLLESNGAVDKANETEKKEEKSKVEFEETKAELERAKEETEKARMVNGLPVFDTAGKLPTNEAKTENDDIDDVEAEKKLQSAVAGELEPVRRLGYDLSQAKLTAIAQNPENYAKTT